MILLTGASGFIGQHLLAALIQEYGAEQMLVLSSKPTDLCAYLPHFNYNFEPNYFVAAGYQNIETIIHAGAYIPKDSSGANDIQQCNSNISHTQKLLEADFPNLKKLIYLSTIDIYAADSIITEESSVLPVSLYGNSKWYVEKMLAVWAQEKELQFHILRVGHVYGPGEEVYRKLIPLCMEKLLRQEEPIEVWGDGSDIRSFIYIIDLVQAILKTLDLASHHEIINLVGAQKISIKDLVLQLNQLSGAPLPIVHLPSTHKARHLVFDNTKMKRLLKLIETPLEDGLRAEWQYMKERYS